MGKEGESYIFLVTCAREAFNLRRYPSFEDRLLVQNLQRNSGSKRLLSDQDIETGVAEMMRLWDFTQRILPDETLTLQRNLRIEFSSLHGGPTGYAANLMAAKIKAEANGDAEVCFGMDTINGFTEYGNRNYGEVQIQITIPKQDVLYFGDTLDCAETGEWVVLNRDPRGMVSVPRANISCSEDLEFHPQQGKFPQSDRIPYMPQYT